MRRLCHLKTRGLVERGEASRISATSSGSCSRFILPINELVPLVCGGCLAIWTFDSRSASWEIGLFSEPTNGTAEFAATDLSDYAMGELLLAFGAPEHPPGHVVLFPELIITSRQLLVNTAEDVDMWPLTIIEPDKSVGVVGISKLSCSADTPD